MAKAETVHDPCAAMKHAIEDLRKAVPGDERKVAEAQGALDAVLGQADPDPAAVAAARGNLRLAQGQLADDQGQLEGFTEEYEADCLHRA